LFSAHICWFFFLAQNPFPKTLTTETTTIAAGKQTRDVKNNSNVSKQKKELPNNKLKIIRSKQSCAVIKNKHFSCNHWRRNKLKDNLFVTFMQNSSEKVKSHGARE